jgi:conjugal transfer ATP-binding protein TraC
MTDRLASLWPDSVLVRPGELAVDGTWVRTLAPRGWPHAVAPGWLEPLIRCPFPHTLAVSWEPVAEEEELRRLDRRLVWQTGVTDAAARSGRLPHPRDVQAVADAQELRAEVGRGETRLFRVSLAMTLRAPSRTALDARTELVERLGQGLFLPFRRLLYRQMESWRATLPFGEPAPGVREMDSAAAASLFPLLGEDVQHETGQVWGENPHTHAPVIIDRDRLPAPHGLVVGWSGSGKSFFGKLITLRARYHGIPVVIVDPEGEYRVLAEDAQHVRLGAAQGLDPLAGPEDDWSYREELALRWLELIIGRVGGRVARALRQSLRDARPPSLDAWRQAVAARDREASEWLDEGVRRWGAAAARPPRLADSRLAVWDLSTVPGAVKPAAYLLALDYVLTSLPKAERRWVIFDEAWQILEHPALAPILEELYRRARKWRTALTLITQDAHDTLRSPTTQVCLRNSPLVLLLRPHPEALEEWAQVFRLTRQEAEILGASGIGEGLLLVDRTRVPIRVRASRQEAHVIDGTVEGRSA